MKNKRNKVWIIGLVLLLIPFWYLLLSLSKNLIQTKEAISFYNSFEKEKTVVILNEYLLNESAAHYDKKQAQDFYNNVMARENTSTMFSYLQMEVDGKKEPQRRFVSKSFYNKFPIKIAEGRGFISEDFEKGKEDIYPLLIGYHLKDKYKLGEHIELHQGEDKNVKAIVVGIIERDSHWHNLYELKDSLDYSEMLPMNPSIVENYFGLEEYTMAINSSFFELKNDDEKKQLETAVQNNKMLKGDLTLLSNYIEEYKKDFLEGKIILTSGLGIVTLILTAFLIYKVKKSVDEQI